MRNIFSEPGSFPYLCITGRVEIRINEYSDTLTDIEWAGGSLTVKGRRFTFVVPPDETEVRA